MKHSVMTNKFSLSFLLCSFFISLSSSVNSEQLSPFTVCVDFHCDESVNVSLSEDHWQSIKTIFMDPALTPKEERSKIRAAIALFETEVGQIAGTWRDKGKNAVSEFDISEDAFLNKEYKDELGQIDCISESRNTTTYLNLLVNHGHLKWHTVSERRLRHKYFIFPHWTAVIRERKSNIKYAVDSWFLDNGEPPYVQELKLWTALKPFKE